MRYSLALLSVPQNENIILSSRHTSLAGIIEGYATDFKSFGAGLNVFIIDSIAEYFCWFELGLVMVSD